MLNDEFFSSLQLMNQMKIRSLVVILILLFVGCKKENEHPQWDIEVLGPMAHATLGINDLISDTLVRPDNDGLLRVYYDTTFSAFELDSIYSIADTTISTAVVFPPFPADINPGTSFVNNNNSITLSTGNVQLKFARIRSGFIRIQIKNTLQSKVFFNYTIPKAKKNGIPFTVNATLDSASEQTPTFFTNDYDFSGYELDLTGNGNQVNLISYQVIATSDPAGATFTIGASDTTVNLQTSLIDIVPSYVRGYLGRNSIRESTNSAIGIGDFIESGIVAIDSVRMQLDLINYIGADGQATLNSLYSINNETGNTVSLVAPSFINSLININRGIDNGNDASPSVRTFILDKSNSNIVDWVQNLPDRYAYDLDVNINPQGNISGSNDFVYSDQLLQSRLQLEMPLRVGLSNVVLVDTIELELATSEEFNRIGNSQFTLLAKNGFPFDMELQLLLVDGSNTITDSLIVPGVVLSALTNTNRIVTQERETRLSVPLTPDKKNRLLTAKKMCVKARLNTANYPDLFPIYSNYKLYLRLFGEGIYSIR